MAKKDLMIKPVAAAVGVAFISSIAVSGMAVASENPFELTDLDAGYMLAGGHGDDKGEDGKCGEGKCGEKGEDGKCGEGKCGEGKCGEEGEKGEDGKCGEGKCGEEGEEGEKGEDGKCGGAG